MEAPSLSAPGFLPHKPISTGRRLPRMSFTQVPDDLNPNVTPDSILTQNVNKNLTSTDICTKSKIMEVFSSNDFKQIKKYDRMLTKYLHTVDKNCIKEVSKDPEVVSLLLGLSQHVTNKEEMSIFTHAIYSFLKNNPEGIIDEGLLFTLREFLPQYTDEVLDFLQIIPVISGYARDSMLSLGIIEDVVDCFKNATSSRQRILAGKVLTSQFTIEQPFQVEDLSDLVPRVVDLLCTTKDDDNAILQVLQTLTEINGREPSFSNVYIKLGIPEYLVQNIDKECLTKQGFSLAGNMCICDSKDAKKIVESGLVVKCMSMLSQDYASDIFWMLSNLIESMPDFIVSSLSDDFVSKSVKMLEEHEKCHETFKEAVYFFSTIFLFSSSGSLERFMMEPILNGISAAIENTESDVSARCLDAISRLMILSSNQPRFSDILKSHSKFKDVTRSLMKLKEGTNNVIFKNLAGKLATQIESFYS